VWILALYVSTLHLCTGLQLAASHSTANREIFAALKVGKFAFFQLAVDKILRLLQKFNG
jgi:hypothetical protein